LRKSPAPLNSFSGVLATIAAWVIFAATLSAAMFADWRVEVATGWRGVIFFPALLLYGYFSFGRGRFVHIVRGLAVGLFRSLFSLGNVVALVVSGACWPVLYAVTRQAFALTVEDALEIGGMLAACLYVVIWSGLFFAALIRLNRADEAADGAADAADGVRIMKELMAQDAASRGEAGGRDR
jgi:hypothetical protein